MLNQDSIESQVQKLEQRAKIAEQELFSKNAEAQAVQSKLDSLKNEFEHTTAILLAKQQLDLNTEAKILHDVVKKQRKLLAQAKDLTKEAELELSTVRADVVLAQDDLKVVLRAVEVAQDDLVETRKQQQQADENLERAKSEQIRAEQVVSALNTEENRLLESISSREGELANSEQRLVETRAAFDALKSKKEETIRQLDAKLLSVTIELEQNTNNDETTRARLADWERTLDARNQNLRIREAKVEEGESKIIRNSDLLKL